MKTSILDLVGFEDICDERVLFDFCGGCSGESISLDLNSSNMDPFQTSPANAYWREVSKQGGNGNNGCIKKEIIYPKQLNIPGNQSSGSSSSGSSSK